MKRKNPQDNDNMAKRAKTLLERVVARNTKGFREQQQAANNSHISNALDDEDSEDDDEASKENDDAEEDEGDDGEESGSEDDDDNYTGPRSSGNARIDAKLGEIITLLNDKHNVFVTGPAGTGKTQLICRLVKHLRRTGQSVQVIAPTGSAALNVQGMTCDSFFGLTPSSRRRQMRDIVGFARSAPVKTRLRRLEILIFDEISMVENEFLEKMNAMMKEARGVDAAFGGARIIAVGDFAQLPPVLPFQHCVDCGRERSITVPNHEFRCTQCNQTVQIEDKWAFRSDAWKKARFRGVLLHEILRQSQPAFKIILMEIWLGNLLTTKQTALLRSRRNLLRTEFSIYPTIKEAAKHNEEKYHELTTPEIDFVAIDDYVRHPRHGDKYHQLGTIDPGTRWRTFLKNHRYPEKLKLREGLQVVLQANLSMDEGLVNGRRGVITGWHYRGSEDLPRFSDRRDRSGFVWDADQGMIDADYFPSLAEASHLRTQHRIRNFIDDCRNRGKPWPIVRFDNGVEVPVYADCSVEEYWYDRDISLFMRTQIPLLQASAITVHKSQGMTMDNYVANLGAAFCPGLEYVALSRARSLETIEVRGLGADLKHRTALEVRSFMKTTFPELANKMK